MDASAKQDGMSGRRIVLLLLASGILIVGLIAALADYTLAFDESLNQFHALRGLVWNIGAYTAARMLVWWGMATSR